MAGQPQDRWGTRRVPPQIEPSPARMETPLPPPSYAQAARAVTDEAPQPRVRMAEQARPLLPDVREAGAKRNTAPLRSNNPLMQPKLLIPALLVLVVLGLAMGFTPGRGGHGQTLAEALPSQTVRPAAGASLTPLASPSAAPSATKPGASVSPVPANLTVSALATQNAHNGTGGTSTTANGSTNDVAGARATPEATVSYMPTQCGGIQEVATQVNVEQTLNGVSVKATQAAVYPIEYLRCILTATGSRDSLAIAASLDKAARAGSTHGAVIDLWVTNSQKDFSQLNLKTALVAAAGQTFSPLATLNGRADLVVSGGQGRSVSLVVAMKNTLDTSMGPITLQIEAPMLGGKQLPGKYQLFLPTP